MREGATALRESGAVRAACGGCHDELLGMFDRLYSEFESKHALEIYILCLSEHDDGDSDGPLSMWRGYGERGQGAALLFDTAQFARYSHLPLVTAPVEYASVELRRDRLHELATSAAQVVSRHPKTSTNLTAVANVYLNRLKFFSVLTKHTGFREEREWRVVYLREHDKAGRLTHPLGYQVTHRGVEPKLKLSYDHAIEGVESPPSPEELIAGILLGPSLSSELSKASVRRMLNLQGLPQLATRVLASGIPFRPTN